MFLMIKTAQLRCLMPFVRIKEINRSTVNMLDIGAIGLLFRILKQWIKLICVRFKITLRE